MQHTLKCPIYSWKPVYTWFWSLYSYLYPAFCNFLIFWVDLGVKKGIKHPGDQLVYCTICNMRWNIITNLLSRFIIYLHLADVFQVFQVFQARKGFTQMFWSHTHNLISNMANFWPWRTELLMCFVDAFHKHLQNTTKEGSKRCHFVQAGKNYSRLGPVIPREHMKFW